MQPVVRASLILLAAAIPAQAQKAAPSDTARRIKEVLVTTTVSGRGEARGAAAVDSVRLRSAPPGTSALKVIEQLPGVNVQGVDGFGMYEWANRITMRGFQTQQIGQTFDGVPLGDMSYGNFNGLGIGRAVDPSNLASTAVSQGTGALGTASANNLGGAVQYVSMDPANRGGAALQQMVGNFAARRSTLKLESGLQQQGDLAFKGLLSFSRFDTDKWKGGGERFSSFPGERQLFFGQGGFLGGVGQQWQDQFNAKGVLLFGAHRVTGYFNHANRKESDYMDLSLSVFNNAVSAPGFAFGPDFDYLSSWAQARQLAELSLTTYNPLTDAAYYFSAQGARMDNLAYLRGEFALGDRAQLLVQPYAHRNRGGGDWHAPSYGASYSPDPIMFRQTQYRVGRGGAIVRLQGDYDLAGVAQQFEVGGWYERNQSDIRRPRWRLVNYAAGPEVDFGNVLRLDFDRTGVITTTQAYAQNTSRFADDRLRLTLGLKWLQVDGDFRNNGNTATNGVIAPIFADATRPSFALATPGTLLPQLALVWRATDSEELFANWSENMNQFPYSPATGVYNANPGVFDFLRTSAKPERATTLEAGIRTTRGRVEAGATVYGIDYRNRLLGITLCPATVTCATGFGNVGSVATYGIEAVANVDLERGFRWYVSAAFNSSKFQDDYLANPSDPASRVATKGKFVQDAPQVLGSTSLSWSGERVTVVASARHVGKRFFNYTNDLNAPGDGDAFVPAYTVADLSATWRFGPVAGLRTLDLQVNAQNLFDTRYLGTMGTNGYSAFGDNQTLLTGAARQLFVTFTTAF